MKTLAIISQKGGTGKTMIATNFATIAQNKKTSVRIIDLDPQASCSIWGDQRREELNPTCSKHASRLERELKIANDEGIELVIIDTPPHSESSAYEAAKKADLILIPVRPCVVDLAAIENSLIIADKAKTPAYVVLNQRKTGAKITEETQNKLDEIKKFLLPLNIFDRISFANAFSKGLGIIEYDPESKASEEIMTLYKFVTKEMKKNG